MALLNCDVFSDVLGLSTSLTVILPQATSTQIGMTGTVRDADPPLLYLLHGLSDDHTIWLRRTSIERYVAPLGLAVVMPQVHRSFYTDEVYGNRYWTFLSEELPELVHNFFRLSRRREDTFVAGLSMGGYGAMKWALRYPERFAAVASLSGAIDIASRQQDSRTYRKTTPRQDDPAQDVQMMRRIFGDQPVSGTDDDLFALLGPARPRHGTVDVRLLRDRGRPLPREPPVRAGRRRPRSPPGQRLRAGRARLGVLGRHRSRTSSRWLPLAPPGS